MLEIFNMLEPFFQDNYRRINVREYARLTGISAPTASKVLKSLHEEGLLHEEADRNYLFYFTNRDNPQFLGLLHLYWRLQLQKSGLLSFLNQEFIHPVIILSGSLSQAQATALSSLEIILLNSSDKKLDLTLYEEKLRRKIQVIVLKKQNFTKSKDLLQKVLSGFKLVGDWQ
ncbi:hypothetical protein HYY69_04075 [Candidatus Woesearchaeota archaeon]|nr:hypothetical protein [Candidatus Woesearchaeota archaeon]